MKTKELINGGRTDVPSMTAGYSRPDFSIVCANCEIGFCSSAIMNDYDIIDHGESGFWEE